MARLDLSKVAVLDSQDVESISANEIVERAKAEAEALGLPEYPRPSTAPESLADKTMEEMSNQDLGNLHVRYTAYAQYVFGQATEAVVAYKIGVASLRLLDAHLSAKLYSQSVPKAEIPARVKKDPLRIDKEIELLKLYATREILLAHYKAYDRQAAALSRNIELRKLDYDISLRDAGIQSRKFPGRQDFRKK